MRKRLLLLSFLLLVVSFSYTENSSAIKSMLAKLDEEIAKSEYNESEAGPFSRLAYAAQSCSLSLVDTLLRLGEDPKAPYGDLNYTALHNAASCNDSYAVHIAEMLIKAGANVNAKGAVAGTPFDSVKSSVLVTVLRKVLREFLENVIVIPEIVDTLLKAVFAEEKIVDMLFKAGFKVEEKANITMACNTPLHFAETAEMVNLLFNAGADINACPESGTPLIKAAYFGKVEVLQRLLELGADINIRNSKGENALQAAIHSLAGMEPERGASFIKALIDSGSNVNNTNFKGETVLDSLYRKYLYWHKDEETLNQALILLKQAGASSSSLLKMPFIEKKNAAM